MASAQLDQPSSGPVKPEFPKPNVGRWLRSALPLLVALGVMWIAEILDSFPSIRLTRFGIRPRRVSGIDGIAFAPFLHVSWGHLIANTVPFVILGSLIAIRRSSRFVSVFVLTAIGSGVGVWLISPSKSVTVGASGVIFGFLGYLLARGVFDRKFTSILIGLGSLVFYGGMLFGVLPNRAGVSWQAHLFGFVSGVAAAWLLDSKAFRARRKKASES